MSGWTVYDELEPDRLPAIVGRKLGRIIQLARSGLLTGIAHLRRGWWRRPPFMPVPDRAHMAWRRNTAYGTDRPAEKRDLVAFLLWADRQRKARA